MEYFDSEYKSNIDSDSEIQEAAIAKHNSDKFSEISDRSTMLSIGFIKSVVLKKAKYYNWKCDIKEIIHYNSPGNQPLMSSVFHLSTESSSDKIEEEYVKQVIQLIDGQPIQYLPGNEELNNEIKNHLDQILEYREKV